MHPLLIAAAFALASPPPWRLAAGCLEEPEAFVDAVSTFLAPVP